MLYICKNKKTQCSKMPCVSELISMFENKQIQCNNSVFENRSSAAVMYFRTVVQTKKELRKTSAVSRTALKKGRTIFFFN